MARISSAVCLLLLLALSTVYEVQGTFLLRHFLRKIPRRSRGMRPFACQGMLKFVNLLEMKCPLKPAYKNLFGNLRSYVGAIRSGSNVDLKGKAEGVQTALSSLGGTTGTSVDKSKVMDVLMTMGKTLTSQTGSSSTQVTSEQRKQVLTSLVQFARVISQVVISSASKSGSSIDMKSLGIDGIDDNVATGSSTSTSTTGSSNTQTGMTGTSTGAVPVPGTGTVPGTDPGTVPGMTGVPASTTEGGGLFGNSFSDKTGTSTGTGAVPVPGTGTDPGTGTFPGIGMAGGPVSSTEGGSSFGKTFSGKTGSTNYEGSINQQTGHKSSQQTTTSNSGSPGGTVSPGSF